MPDRNEEARREIEKKTGFLVPDTAQAEIERAIDQGEVLYSDDERIKKGDQIIFSAFAPLDFKYQGKEAWAIQAKDVIAIL